MRVKTQHSHSQAKNEKKKIKMWWMCLQQAAGNGKKIVPFISFRFVLGSRQTYHDQRRKKR